VPNTVTNVRRPSRSYHTCTVFDHSGKRLEAAFCERTFSSWLNSTQFSSPRSVATLRSLRGPSFFGKSCQSRKEVRSRHRVNTRQGLAGGNISGIWITISATAFFEGAHRSYRQVHTPLASRGSWHTVLIVQLIFSTTLSTFTFTASLVFLSFTSTSPSLRFFSPMII